MVKQKSTTTTTSSCIDVLQKKKTSEDDGENGNLQNTKSNVGVIILIVVSIVFVIGLLALGVVLAVVKMKKTSGVSLPIEFQTKVNIPSSKLEAPSPSNVFEKQEEQYNILKQKADNEKNLLRKTNLQIMIKSIDFVNKNASTIESFLSIDKCITKKIQQEEFIPEPHNENSAKIIVGDTVGVARSLLGEEESYHNVVSILNMANTKKIGGGYLDGALAQEETLFRRSMLPWILDDKFAGLGGEIYPFTWNREIITTTAVPFFGNEQYINSLPAKIINVITAAAPNLNPNSKNRDVYDPNTYERDMQNLFYNIIRAGIEMNDSQYQSFAQPRNKFIVLGAIGCGAFSNNPEIVAKIAKEVIDNMDLKNNQIVFAIFDDKNSKGKGNVQTFKEIFASQA